MCCARPSCASGWIGWRKAPQISTIHGYHDTTCRIMGVVARARGERCGTPRRGARVREVREFFDRGDKRTKCLALSEKIKRSLVGHLPFPMALRLVSYRL